MKKNIKTKQPDKQRKRLFAAPLHIRGKFVSSHLSSELRSSYGRRSVRVRTGDNVRILRGDKTGFEGKITKVDRKKYRIFIEGIKREKSDGTTVLVPVHASKVEVLNLNLDDKRRKETFKKKEVEETKILDEIVEKPKDAKVAKVAKKKVAKVAKKKVAKKKVAKDVNDVPEKISKGGLKNGK
jgi:large subunit ribosomal protein L24